MVMEQELQEALELYGENLRSVDDLLRLEPDSAEALEIARELREALQTTEDALRAARASAGAAFVGPEAPPRTSEGVACARSGPSGAKDPAAAANAAPELPAAVDLHLSQLMASHADEDVVVVQPRVALKLHAKIKRGRRVEREYLVTCPDHPESQDVWMNECRIRNQLENGEQLLKEFAAAGAASEADLDVGGTEDFGLPMRGPAGTAPHIAGMMPWTQEEPDMQGGASHRQPLDLQPSQPPVAAMQPPTSLEPAPADASPSHAAAAASVQPEPLAPPVVAQEPAPGEVRVCSRVSGRGAHTRRRCPGQTGSETPPVSYASASLRPQGVGAVDRTDRPAKRARRATSGAGNARIHPANRYAEQEPDFAALAERYQTLRRFVRMRPDGSASVDFARPEASLELTRILLLEDYGVAWRLPPGQLIPPVTNRANYLHWIADLLALSSPPGGK